MLRHFVFVLAFAAPAAAQVHFYGLGNPGGNLSVMHSVSADGRVAIGAVFDPTPPDSWVMRWTAEGGAERLVEPSSFRGPSAGGISFDGSVIVGTGSIDGEFAGFRRVI